MATAASCPFDLPTSSAIPRSRTLLELCDLDHAELTALYEGGTPPRIDDLSGDLRGRLLGMRMLPEAVTRPFLAWARSETFPWRGKSFKALAADHGEGKNRVIIDALKLFRFETRVAPSRHDGKPAVELDYNRSENPFFIRVIEDEVRQIEPGLLLGQAWLRLGGAKHFVAWFGLEQGQR